MDWIRAARVGELQEATGSTLGLDLGLDKLEILLTDEHVAKGVLGNAVNIVKDQYSEGGGDRGLSAESADAVCVESGAGWSNRDRGRRSL